MARPVCSVCGSSLSIGQTSCASCGASIDWGGSEQNVPRQSTVKQNVSGQSTEKKEICAVCGFANPYGAGTCGSCGARLDGSAAVVESRPEPAPQREPKKEKRPKKKYQGAAKKDRRVDPYVAGAVGVIVVIVGIFAYSEFTRKPGGTEIAPSTPETSSQMEEINHLQHVVEDNPNDVGSLLRLANVLHDASLKDSRLLPRAVENYNKYLALRPDDPNARVDLGIVYYELSKADPANREDLEQKSIHEMETVAKANPDHQPAAFNLGIVNMNTGKRDEARKWFEKAIAINPNSDLGIRAKKVLQEIP